MKAAIFMSTYNKNESLANALYTISRQKTNFPFEVCIVDDGSDVSPEPIIRKFLPDAKYKALGRIGFVAAGGKSFDLVSDDVDVIVVQSAEVMYLQDDLVERLCLAVEPKKFTVAHVKNITVDSFMYKYFDDLNNGRSGLLGQWEGTSGIDVYSGSDRPGGDWLLFLGAMRREDLELVGFRNRCCDVVIQQKMKEHGLTPIFMDDLKAIHQKHPPAHGWPCRLVDQCPYWCLRKGRLLK